MHYFLGSPCEQNPCQNNGKCEEDPWGNYSCICDATHTGIHCELQSEALPCDENPCKANGTCRTLPVLNRRECVCSLGFIGPLCELDVDECQLQPCKNGGLCENGLNNFICNCERTGYVIIIIFFCFVFLNF